MTEAKAKRRAKLPAPRLQLRWEKNDGLHGYAIHKYGWLCHYELVLPLDKFDIRREVRGPRGGIKKIRELVAPLKGPSARGSSSTPCTCPFKGTRYYDDPFRDGAHAQWDAKLLGNLPIYVIAPDGVAFKHEATEPKP
jgi:hypothetical protein